jgi:hypothetical protein
MTRAQRAREQASIEKFVEAEVREVRPRGTSAAVTHVLVAAARAAADVTARTETGAIDERSARETFREAARLMRGSAVKRGHAR